MKKHILFYMLLGCILALTACSDDDYSPSVSPLKVTESNVNFNAKGGQGDITVTSTTPIASVESSDEWCQVTQNGDFNIKVSVGVNEDVDTRNSVVTIKDKNGNETHVAVSQSGLLFILDQHKQVFDDEAASATLSFVHSNEATVTVEEDNEWLKAKVDGDNLILTSEANATGDVRSAYVYCASGPRKDSVLVVQGETKDLLGDYYFLGYNNKGQLRYLNSNLSEGTEDGTLTLTITPFKQAMIVDYDEENLVINFKAGQYLGEWTLDEGTEDETTAYVYTTVWETTNGYYTWGDSYSLDGVAGGYSDGGTFIEFQDNGSWSGSTVDGIRFELFSKQEAVKANLMKKTIAYLLYPFMEKKPKTEGAQAKGKMKFANSLSWDK